jgi:hypothetical protein
LAVTAAPALALERSTFTEVNRIVEVHPTRARAEMSAVAGGATKERIEYAESETGPFALAAVSHLVEGDPETVNGIDTPLTHLSAETTYYVRFVAENSAGSDTEVVKFKTPPPVAPEIGSLSFHTFGGPEPGPSFQGDLQVSPFTNEREGPITGGIETNGLETKYSFEYAESESGPWRPFASGATGIVSAAEDFASPSAETTGLIPGATYHFRLTATNAKGTATKTLSTVTEPTNPEIFAAPIPKSTSATSVDLSASLRTRGFETRWRIEYTTEPTNPGSWSSSAEGTIPAVPPTENPVASTVEADITGLSPETTYYTRLHVDSEHGEPTLSQGDNEVGSFETAGRPVAVTLASHALHGETVRALGSIERHGYDTHYHFQYVTQSQFEQPGSGDFTEATNAPELDAGGGEEGSGHFQTVTVEQDLPGLQAGVIYHYRLVAKSEAGETHGEEQIINVPSPGRTGAGTEEAEPSPCPNEADRYGASAKLPDCRAYEQVTPFDKEGAEDAFHYGGAGTEGGLVGEDGDHFLLHDPGVAWGPSPGTLTSEYVFSRNPEKGWQMTSVRPLGEASAYNYQPQVFNPDLTQTGVELAWAISSSNTSPEVKFQAGPPGGPYTAVASIPRRQVGEGGWAAASADFSKLILAVEDHTLLAYSTGTTSGDDLYEYSEGELRQVNVTGASPGATIGSCGARVVHGVEGYGGGYEEILQNSSPHAVSANGRRVFFEAVPGAACGASKSLYMRVGGAETVDIGAYTFLAANSEGTELLLEKRVGESHEILLYDTEDAAVKSLLSLENAAQEESLIVSEDFTTFYFFAGRSPYLHQGGIYRYDISEAKLRYIVTNDGDSGAGYAAFSISPDGHDLYWISTGVPGVPGGSPGSNQVYRYDSTEGVVQCMSCASPYDPEPRLSATFGDRGPAPGGDGLPNQFDASANGDYVFFDTPAALVPQDIDGEVTPESCVSDCDPKPEHQSSVYSVSSDVYEWRRDGIDGCAHVQGCLALITSGTGGLKNVLIGTDPSGRDVFFGTSEALVSSDDDTSADIYDARIGGGFPPPTPRPVECEGDACSTPLAAPTDLTPSSATFQGADGILAEVGSQTASKAKSKAKKSKPKKSKVKRKRKRRGVMVKKKGGKRTGDSMRRRTSKTNGRAGR